MKVYFKNEYLYIEGENDTEALAIKYWLDKYKPTLDGISLSYQTDEMREQVNKLLQRT